MGRQEIWKKMREFLFWQLPEIWQEKSFSKEWSDPSFFLWQLHKKLRRQKVDHRNVWEDQEAVRPIPSKSVNQYFVSMYLNVIKSQNNNSFKKRVISVIKYQPTHFRFYFQIVNLRKQLISPLTLTIPNFFGISVIT